MKWQRPRRLGLELAADVGYVHAQQVRVGFGTTELHVLRPTHEVDARFLYFVTAGARFRRLGEASMTGTAGQKRVPEDFVRDYRTPIPPLEVQREIANYLDRETARIDEARRGKGATARAVGREAQCNHHPRRHPGGRPKRSGRDSGVAWLGEIPAHRATVQLPGPSTNEMMANRGEVPLLENFISS